jgi:hypothetical protein
MYYFVALTKETTNFPTTKHKKHRITFLNKVMHLYRYPFKTAAFTIRKINQFKPCLPKLKRPFLPTH